MLDYRCLLNRDVLAAGCPSTKHLNRHLLKHLILFLRLWANNGDALSRQYAGTNALKGDFTRTGERNLSGMMKDGVNSASRFVSINKLLMANSRVSST